MKEDVWGPGIGSDAKNLQGGTREFCRPFMEDLVMDAIFYFNGVYNSWSVRVILFQSSWHVAQEDVWRLRQITLKEKPK